MSLLTILDFMEGPIGVGLCLIVILIGLYGGYPAVLMAMTVLYWSKDFLYGMFEAFGVGELEEMNEQETE